VSKANASRLPANVSRAQLANRLQGIGGVLFPTLDLRYPNKLEYTITGVINLPNMTIYTDVELINQCLQGDEFGFEELVNRYKNLVYSIILRQTTSRHDAEDISQEVFLKVYKNLNRYTPEFKFSTWIMRITTNHIIDQHRKKKMETVSYEAYTEEGGTLPGTTPSPEVAYIKQEQTERLLKIISGLPEIYKVPVMLYHNNDLSYQEIADEIGEPVSKVKNRIFRGRKMLKELLSEEMLAVGE